jgi:hypothetical protein
MFSCGSFAPGSYARDACERGWPGPTRRKKRKNMSANYGDVKSGFQTSDHFGWLVMDGRAITALSVAQQSRAVTLGFSTNLPDATDKFLVQKAGALGVSNGSSEVMLSRNNLPNVTLGGSTGAGGVHDHTITINTSGVHNHSASAAANGAHEHTTRGEHLGNTNGAARGYTGATGTRSNQAQLQTFTSGNHSHNITVANNGGHVHTAVIDDSADHMHTLTTESLNGGVMQMPIPLEPLSLSVNSFIYLGV